MAKNVIIFRADVSSSVLLNYKKKGILILGEATQGLDDATLTAEAKYPINFTQPNKRFVLSLHYNGSNSILFVNATKIYQFKAEDFVIKDYALYLGHTLKDFTINNMKKARLKEIAKFFSVDFNFIDTNNILDIYRYLMKGKQYKRMFGLILKMFMRLLISIINVSNHTTCMSLSNQKGATQSTHNAAKNFTTIHLRLN